MTRTKTSFLLALSLSAGVAAPAAAAVAAPEIEPPPPAAAGGAAAPWSVSLEAHGLSVDEAALRAAIERELARAELPDATRPVQVEVSVDAGGSLRVRYRNALGTELSRSVAAPARAEEVPETSALLVGNLARDEASGLLAQLQSTPSAQAEAAPVPVPANAAGPPAPDQSQLEPEAPPRLSHDSVNLTLFHPFSLRNDSERRHLLLEFGAFYSRTGAITGLSLTFGGVSRIDGALHGMQLGSLGYWHGGRGDGLRIGGVFGVSKQRFSGVSIAGAVNVEGEHLGVDLAGAANIASGLVAGAQISGALNHSSELDGLQVAGAVNVSRGNTSGAQVAGAVNVSRGATSGAQVAGAVNVSRGYVDGLQLSGAANVAGNVSGAQLSVLNIGGSIDGAQIGVVNVAEDVDGLQIGVVNVARSVRGQSIGLVPYNREGGIKLATWYNSSQPFNVGLRFHAGLLYVMPTLAYDPGSAVFVSDPGRTRYTPGTSLGLRIPLDRAYVDVDAHYSQRFRGWEPVVNDFALRYRILAGWRILPGFSVFAGGGLRQRVRAPESVAERFGPELSVGMELL